MEHFSAFRWKMNPKFILGISMGDFPRFHFYNSCFKVFDPCLCFPQPQSSFFCTTFKSNRRLPTVLYVTEYVLPVSLLQYIYALGQCSCATLQTTPPFTTGKDLFLGLDSGSDRKESSSTGPGLTICSVPLQCATQIPSLLSQAEIVFYHQALPC